MRYENPPARLWSCSPRIFPCPCFGKFWSADKLTFRRCRCLNPIPPPSALHRTQPGAHFGHVPTITGSRLFTSSWRAFSGPATSKGNHRKLSVLGLAIRRLPATGVSYRRVVWCSHCSGAASEASPSHPHPIPSLGGITLEREIRSTISWFSPRYSVVQL